MEILDEERGRERRGQTSLKVLPVCGHVEQPREVVVCGVVHVHMQVPVLVMNAYNSTKLRDMMYVCRYGCNVCMYCMYVCIHVFV